MSSKFKVIPAHILWPFKAQLGVMFDKVCADVKSFLGRCETNAEGKSTVQSTIGRTTITDKGVLKSKEGYSMQLPLNSDYTYLVKFGMRLTELDENMGTRLYEKDGKACDPKVEGAQVVKAGISADVPSHCKSWLDKSLADFSIWQEKESARLKAEAEEKLAADVKKQEELLGKELEKAEK